MRTRFIETLIDVAATDDRVWLINGDLGYSVLEAFRDKFPQRFVNAGVAEQNMTGVAAGLALAGKVAITYSIANFPTFRCLEQVRNDIGYHNLNVKIVSVGGGYAYGSAGYTHHAVEDMAVMRVIPNMVVLAPADPVEAELATRAMLAHPGPCYLRLGKAGETVIHKAVPGFQIGMGIMVRTGTDAALISTGGMLGEALLAAEMLAQKGISVAVASMPTVQPIDNALVAKLGAEVRLVCSVEEHGPGGLSAAVADSMLSQGSSAKFHAFRLAGAPESGGGSQSALRKKAGLAADNIVATLLARLAKA